MRRFLAISLIASALLVAAAAAPPAHVATAAAAGGRAKGQLIWSWRSGPGIRVWYNRRATEDMYEYLIEAGAAAGIGSIACELIPYIWVERACRALVAYKATDYIVAVRHAHRDRQCVTIDFYPGAIGRQVIADRGGKRCVA
jgi:hypothetical protein